MIVPDPPDPRVPSENRSYKEHGHPVFTEASPILRAIRLKNSLGRDINNTFGCKIITNIFKYILKYSKIRIQLSAFMLAGK